MRAASQVLSDELFGAYLDVILSDLLQKLSEVQPSKRRISSARLGDPSLVARRSELRAMDPFRVTPSTKGIFRVHSVAPGENHPDPQRPGQSQGP